MTSSNILFFVFSLFIFVEELVIAKPQHDLKNPSNLLPPHGESHSSELVELGGPDSAMNQYVSDAPNLMADLHSNITSINITNDNNVEPSLPSVEPPIIGTSNDSQPSDRIKDAESTDKHSNNGDDMAESFSIEVKPNAKDLVDQNKQLMHHSFENTESSQHSSNPVWSTSAINQPKPTPSFELGQTSHEPESLKEVENKMMHELSNHIDSGTNLQKPDIKTGESEESKEIDSSINLSQPNNQIDSSEIITKSNLSPFGNLGHKESGDMKLKDDSPIINQLNNDGHFDHANEQKGLQNDVKQTINDIKSQLHDTVAISSNQGASGNENIIRHLNQNNPSNCSANEVYIIDGERTLLLTNRKLTTDIETMEDENINHQRLIQNQNEIIFQLKQRLKNSESQVEDTLSLLVKHEQSYQKLIIDLNETKSRENDLSLHNEALQQEVSNERKGRVHYQQLADHFKEEVDRANEQLNTKTGDKNKEFDEQIHVVRSKYEKCKKKVNEMTQIIQGLHHEQALIKDNLGAFNRTRVKYSKHRCRAMEEQLDAQDDALFLLKDQVKTQAHTLESMNRLISMKHDTIENIHNAVNVQLEEQKKAEDEYAAKDQLLLSQQETIRLLQQLKDEHDYLRRARDIALGILQGTVYKMVNNIDSCKSEVVDGLKARIEYLEKSQQPLQDMINTLKASLSASSKVTQMEQNHNSNLKRLLNVRIKTLELMTQEKRAVDDTAAFCTGKCNFNPEIVAKIDQLYRPANEFSCKPICKMIKRKHSSKKSKDGQQHHHISHNPHLHKKLPSFMATKQEDKIFDFK